MAGFDLSQVLSQVILRPRAFGYLAGLLPGLFFEISLFLANPGVIPKPVGVSGYISLAIALILAFIIGSGFIFLVRIIQTLLGWLYRAKMILRRALLTRLVLPVVTRRIEKRKPWLLARVTNIHRYILEHVVDENPPHLRAAQDAWEAAAAVLLQRRYGIDTPDRFEIWNAWYSILGTPSPEDVRGSIFVIACHATGWCGLVAVLLAPALNNAYYLLFCLLLIVFGVIHDWNVAFRLNDPVVNAWLRTRVLLAEMRYFIHDKDGASTPNEASEEEN